MDNNGHWNIFATRQILPIVVVAAHALLVEPELSDTSGRQDNPTVSSDRSARRVENVLPNNSRISDETLGKKFDSLFSTEPSLRSPQSNRLDTPRFC